MDEKMMSKAKAKFEELKAILAEAGKDPEEFVHECMMESPEMESEEQAMGDTEQEGEMDSEDKAGKMALIIAKLKAKKAKDEAY